MSPARAIGIITALPIECFAVRAVMGDPAEADASGRDGGMSCYLGTVPSRRPGVPHQVVLALLAEDGGIAAAQACANLRHAWGVEQILMCGIACGVPAPDDPPRHVRLGDILVAEDGVVPYGHVRVEAEGDEIRRPAARPSVVLKAAARRLRIGEEGGSRPWERLLDVRGRPGLATYRRPPSTSDVLWADDGGTVGRHPDPVRSGHEDGLPKVHFGRLGSGAKLIRSAAERNRLARRHRLLGFDMEGDGVSDGAYLQGVDWFMVRGVSDYGAGKNDLWHRYAALAAAAYTHALLGQVEPLATPPGPAVGAVPGDGLVAALLDVRSMRDGSSRDRVIASLPEQYRNGLPRSRSAYEDVAGLVRALGRQPGGLEALRQVLQDLEQDSRPVRRFAGLIRPDDRSNN